MAPHHRGLFPCCFRPHVFHLGHETGVPALQSSGFFCPKLFAPFCRRIPTAPAPIGRSRSRSRSRRLNRNSTRVGKQPHLRPPRCSFPRQFRGPDRERLQGIPGGRGQADAARSSIVPGNSTLGEEFRRPGGNDPGGDRWSNGARPPR